MRIYDYEGAFGRWDRTSPAMRKAISRWFRLYYSREKNHDRDTCQQVAYTVVNKLTKAIFGEYTAGSSDPVTAAFLRALDQVKEEAMQLTLVGGESFLKPCVTPEGILFRVIPRDRILIFGRNLRGEATDAGTVERCADGNFYYTLLERRSLDAKGYLTVQNRLFRSRNSRELGVPVELGAHPVWKNLPETYTYREKMGSIGLISLKTPMLNCVDGSQDGVSVYAPAEELIDNIDRNEAMFSGEFRRGQSRIIASADLLCRGPQGDLSLEDEVFVGLDDSPDQVGFTIFSPQLRYEAFLERKQEYLRNVESLVGLKRGMLSDANVEDRTATEIASSAGEFNLTVLGFQKMWQAAVAQAVTLCARLARAHKLAEPESLELSMDWGNGVLYDEDKQWQNLLDMVKAGILRPEAALGIRFRMPFETEEERERIRQRFLPKK